MQWLQRLVTRPWALAALIAGLTALAISTMVLAFTIGGAPVGAFPSGLGAPTGQRITLDQAQRNLQAALNQTGSTDLRLDEIMEFTDNYYAIVKEKSTGMGAFELLVDPVSGAVYPEYGPTMMWNAKYGMMGGGTYPMAVSANQAQQIAQRWLDQHQPGSTTEAPDTFYGYHTLHILKGGVVTGMLSVNGASGQVWYHSWHGAFVQMREMGP